MSVDFQIPELKEKYQDYRDGIPGDSYNWGPAITATSIQYLTFHHSVTAQTAKNDGDWKKECDYIANLHINGRGWDGVGYRFIICSDGTVAYVGDLSHGGSGVANKNDVTFSACMVGDFTKELPTASQIHSAHVLADFFLFHTPQYPNLDKWEEVLGHKEWNATACPGTNWKGVEDSLYERIKNDLWQGYPDPQPPVPSPEPPAPPEPVPPVPPTDPCADVTKERDELKAKLDQIRNLLA